MEIYILNHKSDCAVHNEPAFPKGKCDCDFLGAEDKISEISSHASCDEGSYEAASEAARTMLWECKQIILNQAKKVDIDEMVKWWVDAYSDRYTLDEIAMRIPFSEFLQSKLKGD
jgi:CRISPR/Cas system-associated endonuclease Cas3-HD